MAILPKKVLFIEVDCFSGLVSQTLEACSGSKVQVAIQCN